MKRLMKLPLILYLKELILRAAKAVLGVIIAVLGALQALGVLMKSMAFNMAGSSGQLFPAEVPAVVAETNSEV
jgi:hypothetical protein